MKELTVDMPDEPDESHVARARSLRKEGRLEEAGDNFTAAAYGDFAKGTPTVTWYSGGETNLERAALCYRICEQMERCENRCRQGILIAEEMVDRVFDMDPGSEWGRARRAIWHEFIGDFRTIAGLDGSDAAYSRAASEYRRNGDPETSYAEEEHPPIFNFYRSVVGAVEQDPGPFDTVTSTLTFSQWVELKRSRLGEAIEILCDRGEWDSPEF